MTIKSSGLKDCAAIERIEVSVYTIPTDFPEADGTYSWDSTTLVLVEAKANGVSGLGYTYADEPLKRVTDRYSGRGRVAD